MSRYPTGPDPRERRFGPGSAPTRGHRRPVDRPYASESYLPPPSRNHHLDPLDHDHRTAEQPEADRTPTDQQDIYGDLKKITVMRVAARRARYLGGRGVSLVHSAATADGADRSGLTALTLPVIINYAVDAAMAVALANTLFFAAATAESKLNVGLYLALTIAPFALIAPLIGPLLDRLQQGRRIAMATTFGLRVILALLIITNAQWDPASGQLNYDPWVLYPCALGLLVLSKSFGVLKSAVAPRVLPPSIDLVRVNSRLTSFGLIGGTITGGAIAVIFEMLLGQWLPFHIPGAMVWLAIIATAGAVLCMKIPSWVEVTEGEIPTSITYRDDSRNEPPAKEKLTAGELAAKMRQPLGRAVIAGLWGNGTIRILTGFLTLYIAFYAKAQEHVGSGWVQLLMLGAVGAAAGVGNAIGNGVGTRIELSNPLRLVLWSTIACFVVSLLAAVFGALWMAVLVALIASGASALAKVCLDSTIQNDLPDESRASAFGRSETVLQLGWVGGAALGVLLPTQLWIGFTVITVLLGIGLAQTLLTSRGKTLIPGFGGRRPEHAEPTLAFEHSGPFNRSGTATEPPTRPGVVPDPPTTPTGTNQPKTRRM